MQMLWCNVCSVVTGKKLFGEGYSGLEYDYRGLIKLYNSVGNYEKVFEYHNVLSNWNRLRDRQFAVADALEDVNTTPQQTQEVVQAFLLAQSLSPTRPCLGWCWFCLFWFLRMRQERNEGQVCLSLMTTCVASVAYSLIWNHNTCININCSRHKDSCICSKTRGHRAERRGGWSDSSWPLFCLCFFSVWNSRMLFASVFEPV